MSEAAVDPLAGLRGYHLPDPVSWWPPAPGWWLVAGLALGVVAALIWWGVRRYRRRAAARAALQELTRLRAALAADDDGAAFARGLSRLLRRFALARFPRREVAGLAGVRWLAFLDAHGGGGRFRDGPGRVLSDAPYKPAERIPDAELALLVEEWIARNREVRP
ncbi:MAG: DUF4381 domain-containing protein [Chromatiales bacterium]